jgi:uncharacterized protein (DUF488 family)
VKTLFTIGYASRTVAELIRELRAAGIGLVLDVRDKPISRQSGFSKRALSEALEDAGIHYEHAGFAGNPKTLRDASNSRADALAKFERHLDRHPGIVEELRDRIALAGRAGTKVALLCLERDPATCHRTVLARRWGTRGRKVVPLA